MRRSPNLRTLSQGRLSKLCLGLLTALMVVAVTAASAAAGEAPKNTALPAVSPTTPNQFVPETASTGSWINGPTSFSYRWEVCLAEGGCSENAGTESTITLNNPIWVGARLRVVVTAENAYGKASATSAWSEPVRKLGAFDEYAAKNAQKGITAGPDGNVWLDLGGKIAKVTPTGGITEYSLPSGANAVAIAAGPDGNLWFADNRTEAKIGKITPLGVVTEYSLPKYTAPLDIAAGPDGNMWFTTQSRRVGKITTSGTITEYSALPEGVRSSHIISGPDGKLWVSEFDEHGNLWKVTTAGVGTEVPVPDSTWIVDLATGPDGNVWFTVSTKLIGKVVPATGAVTEYPLAGTEVGFVSALATGPDGNVWFTTEGNFGRIKPTGAIKLFPIASNPYSGIAAGPDGRMWTAAREAGKEASTVTAIAP